MDSHNVGRGRGGMEKALAMITAKTLVIGIESDILFPLVEQRFLASHIKGASFITIGSAFGHDGFLLEYAPITLLIRDFLLKQEKIIPQLETTKVYGNT
jgi:homoserine O-acetyltransferase